MDFEVPLLPGLFLMLLGGVIGFALCFYFGPRAPQ